MEEVGIVFTAAGLFVLALIVLIVGFGSWYSVAEGNVGVIFDKRTGFNPSETTQGWHFKVPIVQRAINMPFRTHTIGFYGGTEEKGQYGAVTPKDSNGINFNVDITVRYSLDPTQASEFVEQKGEGIAAMESILITAVRSDAVRGVLGKYPQEDIPENRAELAGIISTTLQKRIDSEASGKLKPGFIRIEAVDMRNVEFAPKIEAAIIDKQTRKQEAEKQSYILQQAEMEREIEVVRADAGRQAAILTAEGRAQAILIEATAKAEGTEKYNRALATGNSEALVAIKWADAFRESSNRIIFWPTGGNDEVTLNHLNMNSLMGLEGAAIP